MAKLKRAIGEKALLFLSIVSILGVGVYFLPAVGAGYAGPSSIISWLLMSIVALLIATCFAELVSMYPKAGGTYEYVKNAFGEFPSFIAGWASWLVANISIAMIVVASARSLFPYASTLFSIAASVSIIAIFSYISYRGVDFSTKVLFIFGILALIGAIAFLLPGLLSINTSAFYPLAVEPLLILLAAYFVSEAFFGWEYTAYLAEEVKDAKKVVPKVIVLTTLIVVIISALMALTFLGNIGSAAETSAPPHMLAAKLYNEDVARLLSVLVIIPFLGTAAVLITSSPRLLYSMSRDKILVQHFEKIHKRHSTPYNAIIFQGFVTSLVIVVGFGSFKEILSFLLPLSLIIYTVVMLSFVKLRLAKPQLKRGYRAPFGIAGALAVMLLISLFVLSWLFMVNGSFDILAMDLLLVFFGIPLYLMIKLHTDKGFVEKFFDKVSWAWDASFSVWYGPEEQKKVLSRLKLKGSKKILDFGCGTGTTTLALARRVKGNGKILAVDISGKQLERAFRKMKEHEKIRKAKELSNVIFMKSENATFEKNSFDCITAVGVLEYLENPKRTLRKLFYSLKKDGSFSFLSFGKSFGIPEYEFLNEDDKIRSFFENLGIKASIKREKKKFTEYIYIWGKKG